MLERNLEFEFADDALLYDDDICDFPEKDRTRRAVRRKNTVKRGRKVMRLRKARYPFMDADYICFGNKLNSMFYYSETPHKDYTGRKPVDIWDNSEASAPASARRKMEAMIQQERAYVIGDEADRLTQLHINMK